MSNPPLLPLAPLVIGVDAGGSKTVARLARIVPGNTLQTLGVGRAGPANLRRAGGDEVARAVEEAVAAAFLDAGRAREPVAAACLSIAGAGHRVLRRRLSETLSRLGLALHVEVTHDARPLLEWTTSPGVGVALIAGTGSLAYARNAAGEETRAGGWGFLLGDGGSGFDLARRGLSRMVAAVDRGEERPPWGESLLCHFGARSIDALIDLLYDGAPDVRRIAQAAPILLEAAAQGDATARDIRERAAETLAEYVACAAAQAGFASGTYELVLAGGLLVHDPAYRDALRDALDRSGNRPAAWHLAVHPDEGAARRAARIAGRTPDADR